MLGNSLRGLNQQHLHNLYRGAVLPMMTYASTTWWNGSKNLVNPLTIMQNKAVRHITGAFRMTPIYAMEIEASMPPIPLVLDYYNDRAATRLTRLDSRNPVVARMPSDTLPVGLIPDVAPPRPPRPPVRNYSDPIRKAAAEAKAKTSLTTRLIQIAQRRKP
jgi:hypothetical protein